MRTDRITPPSHLEGESLVKGCKNRIRRKMTMLYDHNIDPDENTNLSKNKEYEELVITMADKMR